jgi:exodeoxyribonuclease VII large subunit
VYTPTPKVYSINELNNYVKNVLDSDANLRQILVSGEVSNFKAHYSGHMYMTLKDETSSVKAVMFAGNASKLRFSVENGMKVLVLGTVSLYPRDGSYQLYISSMQPDGIGALSIAFEQLKEKLSKEGLFDVSHKKKLPSFPDKIGVVTSATGAAIQDIFNVLSRRYPVAEVVVRPAQVQGDGAAEDIAKAIEEFNAFNGADVLIVGRGGGSIEDLWAFNEEVVARAVFNSKIPVISAVGHETDYTICDFVADLRAPTPSAAAEIAVPDITELTADLLKIKQQMIISVKNKFNEERTRLLAIEKSGALKDPLSKLNENKRNLLYFSEKINDLTQAYIDRQKLHFSSLAGKLDTLSPLGVIARGYAIVSKGEDVLTKAKDFNIGDTVNIKLSDGNVNASVTGICEE